MATRSPMSPRASIQLARIFGIRVGVSMSWFLILLILIFYLSGYFHEVLGGSTSTAYAVAVGGAFGYFVSLILHELGHALVSRRLGIPILGIDLWFFGGMARPAREPETAGEEFKVAAAGPAVTFAILLVCVGATALIASGGHFTDAVLTREGFTTTPALALLAWLAFINAALLVFNLVPAFPLDGGRIARAAIWWRTGDRHRGTRITGRAGQGFALALGLVGLLGLLDGDSFGLFTLVLGLILYQASGGAVMQGALGQRIQSVTVADIMDREPPTIPVELRVLDAQEQFFQHYRRPWFAVVDHARHFLGVVRSERIDAELAAGRPALEMGDV
ncbi:MAG TPA: site-2 protease family protein, partial [Solirubrobacteraceae bacterium]|nr:site-2 protease family protein [Solirubrobacteraceae bacterium]